MLCVVMLLGCAGSVSCCRPGASEQADCAKFAGSEIPPDAGAACSGELTAHNINSTACHAQCIWPHAELPVYMIASLFVLQLSVKQASC